MNKVVSKALTFDDVLIIPKESDIESRNEIDISTSLFERKFRLDIPIISAPMDSVTENELAKEMIENGAGAVIHRYNTKEKQNTEICKTLESAKGKKFAVGDFVLGFTLGIKDIDEQFERAAANIESFKKFSVTPLVVIDVAHGHHKKVLQLANKLKKEYSNKILLCAGNICTLDAAKAYRDSGIDIAKIGVGPGAVCGTRSATGCGYPQLSAIMNIAWNCDIGIIADGGMKNSGDIVKALAAGADAVMIGSLLASCPESCAQQIQDEKGNKYKIYRGMASYSAKKDHQINDTYVEGESVLKKLGDPVKKVIDKLASGIRSGCSYVGARNLGELQQKAEFVEVSQGTNIENMIRP